MNGRDRRHLMEMDDRQLADIGISRSDLPRLCAKRAWSSCLREFFLRLADASEDSSAAWSFGLRRLRVLLTHARQLNVAR